MQWPLTFEEPVKGPGRSLGPSKKIELTEDCSGGETSVQGPENVPQSHFSVILWVTHDEENGF